MSELGGKAAASIIDKTVAELHARITKAERLAQDDVNRCKVYLEAAQTAIHGLSS